MVKKADRVARTSARETRRLQYAREDAAMQAFLDECRAFMPADVWEKQSEEARRSAGEKFHVVEHMVSILATTQIPISPPLRRALDAMLDAFKFHRANSSWEELRNLNYSAYWKSRYGY